MFLKRRVVRSTSSVKALLAGMLCAFLPCVLYAQTREYRDIEGGISLSLPPGWTWDGPKSLGDQKSIVVFQEPATQLQAKLWVQILQTPEPITPADKMDRRLLKQAQRKVEQRRREGYENYHLRDGSCKLHPINGRSAVSCVAEYSDHGRDMVEYQTRVRSENTNVFYFARMPAERLEDFKMRLDTIIETLQVR